MMRVLNNASITIKSLLTALVCAIVLIGMAALTVFSLLEIQRTNATATAATAARSDTRAAWTNLARAHAALYRAVSLKSQNVAVAKVTVAKDAYAHAIADAKRTLASVKTEGLAIDARLAVAAVKDFEAYAASADQAAAFVEDDAFTATMFMGDAEQKFDVAQQSADVLLNASSALSQTLDERLRWVVRESVLIIPLCAGLAVLLSAGATAWLSRLISRPILAITAAMRRLAEGDLATELPSTGRADEIGQMARALSVFRDNAREARALQTTADHEHAAKARRQAAMDRYTDDFGTSAAGVMASLVRSAETMRGTASEMSDAAQKTRADATATAAGATESAHHLVAVAEAAEQMAASINEIGQQVSHATVAAREAVERTSATDTSVSDMASAADRVGEVVQLIDAIASQTDLLALNATIEAARAGDAGRGFAVVAGEVKALAAQTARATRDIGTHIQAIRGATADAVNAVREAGVAIAQVEQVASAIATAVEEQAAVTRNIASSVQSVTVTTRHVTSAMREVSHVAEATDAASRVVLTGADELSANAARLRDEVSLFLRAMTSTNEDERRLFVRVPGNGAVATLLAPGGDISAPVVDISRGGVALSCDWSGEPGSRARVVLPGTGEAIAARVVRTAPRRLGLTFPQDAATLALVDASLLHIGGSPKRAAA
jgi:methyl-accepting chemotaxis protein